MKNYIGGLKLFNLIFTILSSILIILTELIFLCLLKSSSLLIAIVTFLSLIIILLSIIKIIIDSTFSDKTIVQLDEEIFFSSNSKDTITNKKNIQHNVKIINECKNNLYQLAYSYDFKENIYELTYEELLKLNESNILNYAIKKNKKSKKIKTKIKNQIDSKCNAKIYKNYMIDCMAGSILKQENTSYSIVALISSALPLFLSLWSIIFDENTKLLIVGFIIFYSLIAFAILFVFNKMYKKIKIAERQLFLQINNDLNIKKETK